MLSDILALQGVAKMIWGEEIMFPDDFGMEVYDWQYHLGRIVTSKNPKQALKIHVKAIRKDSL